MRVLLVVLAAVVLVAVQARTGAAVSVASRRPANGSSYFAVISAKGRFVAFDSYASNLVRGVTNDRGNVFVRDRLTGKTELVSVSSDGTQGNADSSLSGISPQGRFVAFESTATNLVPGDTHGRLEVYLRDRLTRKTERVSVSSDGRPANQTSGGGAISLYGRFVAFYSSASNLVPGDTNGRDDVFVRDRLRGTTERVSVSSDGKQGNSDSAGPRISADGRFVFFTSYASNLAPPASNVLGPTDVFVHDRLTGTTERVSVSSDGTQGNGDSGLGGISPDGRFVAFYSSASNLVPGDTNGRRDVFVRDRLRGTTERVSVSSDGTQGNGDSAGSLISADGRFVVFDSYASNLVAGDTSHKSELFVRDRQKGTTRRVNLSSRGKQPNAATYNDAISASGQFVVFTSHASNLAGPTERGEFNIFVVNRLTGKTYLVSASHARR